MKANLLIVLAIVLAFGSVLVSCDTGSDLITDGGILTVTDIPAEYNGCYTTFWTSLGNGIYISGYESIDSTETMTLPQIQNRRVRVPLWLIIPATPNNTGNDPYTGNDAVVSSEAVDIALSIYDENHTMSYILARIEFTSITFSNGSAVISAAAGTLEAAER